MELAELTAYAKEKYNIEEEHKWADFPGFSVLCHPRTGKWVALLMRQWDTDSGTQIERCDLKCGRQSLAEFAKPYLTAPIRMQGSKWIDAAFDRRTEPAVIFALFDRAVAAENDPGYGRGATIVLQSRYGTFGSQRRTPAETPLPFAGSTYRPAREQYPEKLRQMRNLFQYGWESRSEKAKHFYLQAKFMEDYEDDAPLPENFICYYPTYQDLTTKQLRGYFAWRTLVRRGEFKPVTSSAAYLYIYELLNGVGAASPEESLQKLQEFEAGFLDAGEKGPAGAGAGVSGKTGYYAIQSRLKEYAAMRKNLRRWMLELAVVKGLPPETVRQYADPEILEKDAALAVLRRPAEYTDEEVFEALCRFGGKKTAQTPVMTADPERGRHLFAEAWRAALAGYRETDSREGADGPGGHGEKEKPDGREKDLFTLCFGTRKKRQWFPLSNAVYHHKGRHADADLALDEIRSYHCRDGMWRTEGYEDLFFDKKRFQSFLHETDAKLRRYLKTGRYLKEKPEDALAAPFIDAVIAADKEAILEASRPKITIDLSGLDRIRRDAMETRDSLLTEEERREAAQYAGDTAIAEAAVFTEESGDLPDSETAAEPEAPAETELDEEPWILQETELTEDSDLPLDAVQIRILRLLLMDEPEAVKELIRENHLMPALAADLINEALYDEIGDIVIVCEDDELALVDDYREDLAQMLEDI